MKKLSEIYDLFRKGELKTGDVITFSADVSTKKETKGYYSTNFVSKNLLVQYFLRKNKKSAGNSLFNLLKINKTFVIKGVVNCFKDEFFIDDLLYVNDSDSMLYRLKYLEDKNPLNKLISYLSNEAEAAACEYFFNNKERILSTNDSMLINYTLKEKEFDKRIANEKILSELLKTNYIDDFGETCLSTFIMNVFLNDAIYTNPNREKIFSNAAKYLYNIINEIPDDTINMITDNGDNNVNLMCCNDTLSPIIEKLLKRNVSFNTINDVGCDSLCEAIRHNCQLIVNLIVKSGKVKITDEHRKLAEKYFIKL